MSPRDPTEVDGLWVMLVLCDEVRARRARVGCGGRPSAMFRMIWRLDRLDVEVQRADRDHHGSVFMSFVIDVGGEQRTLPASGGAMSIGGNLHTGDKISLGHLAVGPFLVLPDSVVKINVTAVNVADIESTADQVVAASDYVEKVNAAVFEITLAVTFVFAAAEVAGVHGALLIPGVVLATTVVVEAVAEAVEGIANAFTTPHCNGPVLSWFEPNAGGAWLFLARAGIAARSATGQQLTSPEECGAAPVYRLHFTVMLDPTPSPGDRAAVARQPERLDVFWVGGAGQVRTTWWDGSVSTTRWARPFDVSSLGSIEPGNPGAVTAVARDPDHLNVAWVGPQGQVQVAAWTARESPLGWRRPEEVAPAGSAAPGPVAQVARHPQRLDVFWIGSQGQIRGALWDDRRRFTAGESWKDLPPLPGWGMLPEICPAGSAA